MAIRIPRPSDVLGAAQMVAGLPSRTVELVDETVRLLARVTALVDKAEVLLARTEETMASVSSATKLADEVIARADATTRSVQQLTDLYAPIAEKAAPLARQFADELSEQEVHAAIQLIDQLPAFTEHMESDIMPILATMDRVGPDIHELLNVLRDVRQAIIGLPGFAYFRRRGEGRDGEEDAPAKA